MDSGTENELIACCRRGDAAAWDTLFERHYGAVARFVFQLSPGLSREDTEEICQEAFLAVVRNLGSFRGGSQFQTWVFRIAANKARDYLERRLAAKRGGGQATVSLQAEDPESGLTLDPPSSDPGPDTTLMNAEKMALIRTALDQLGDPCREILELRYFGDLSYEDLAETLELNPKTVSSRLSKCLDRLETIMRRLVSRENSMEFPV